MFDLEFFVLCLLCVAMGYGMGWLHGHRGSLRFHLKKRQVQIAGRLKGLGHVCPVCRTETEILALDDGSFICEPCLKNRASK